MGQETNQTVPIITIGTSTIKRCYGWSCNERCLFYHDVPVCYKAHGILLCHEKDIEILRAPFKELDIHCYTFDGDIHSYEAIIKQALHRFYDCATNANWLDDVILQFVNSLNCKYDNKYLNYCKGLSPDKFREVTKKHVERLKLVSTQKKELRGLWYYC